MIDSMCNWDFKRVYLYPVTGINLPIIPQRYNMLGHKRRINQHMGLPIGKTRVIQQWIKSLRAYQLIRQTKRLIVLRPFRRIRRPHLFYLVLIPPITAKMICLYDLTMNSLYKNPFVRWLISLLIS